MLVLSRHRDESIIVAAGTPNEITITVVDIRGDKVRIGVQAAKEISVHRLEVQRAINRQKGNESVDL